MGNQAVVSGILRSATERFRFAGREEARLRPAGANSTRPRRSIQNEVQAHPPEVRPWPAGETEAKSSRGATRYEETMRTAN